MTDRLDEIEALKRENARLRSDLDTLRIAAQKTSDWYIGAEDECPLEELKQALSQWPGGE